MARGWSGSGHHLSARGQRLQRKPHLQAWCAESTGELLGSHPPVWCLPRGCGPQAGLAWSHRVVRPRPGKTQGTLTAVGARQSATPVVSVCGQRLFPGATRALRNSLSSWHTCSSLVLPVWHCVDPAHGCGHRSSERLNEEPQEGLLLGSRRAVEGLTQACTAATQQPPSLHCK